MTPSFLVATTIIIIITIIIITNIPVIIPKRGVNQYYSNLVLNKKDQEIGVSA